MNICVYGASSNAIDKSFISAGETLGRRMGERGHNLVFGAGGGGMMGAVARGMTAGKGRIKGVVPSFFNVDGILYDKCDELVRTDTMRQRKQIMEDSCDAFITTAGGIGTFEEFFEILTLKQLGRHDKPIVVLNTNGYYDDMLTMMKQAMGKKFVFDSVADLYFVTEDIESALDYIENYQQKGINASDYKSV